MLVDRLSVLLLLLDMTFFELPRKIKFDVFFFYERNSVPSFSRLRFVSEFSLGLSLLWFLSESRDRLFGFELVLSFSSVFLIGVVDVCRTSFLSIEGAGLESSSRITQIGDGGWTGVVFSGSAEGSTDSFSGISDATGIGGVGESWTTGGVDCGGSVEINDLNKEEKRVMLITYYDQIVRIVQMRF